MADEELELDVEKPKSKKTLIIVIAVVLLLNVAGIGTWLYLTSEDSSSGEEKTEQALLPLHYQTLEPEFTINFPPGGKARYLQIDLQVATRDPSALAVVSTYKPVIRNDILVAMSNVSYEELTTRAGKEMLQKKILNTINRIVSEAIHSAASEGAPAAENTEINADAEAEQKKVVQDNPQLEALVEGPIENVYFASFIMQ